jgi:nicotinamidase-related amidase
MPLSLAERLEPGATALLVIDVQNDYANPDGFLGSRGADLSRAVEMIPRLQSVVSAARSAGVLVVFTRNWHRPATDSPAWIERLEANGLSQDNRPGRADTWGAEFCGVLPADGDEIVSKARYDAFLGTNLEYLLRARGIRTVVCTGTATSVCVESTARSAHLRDFHLVVIGDCCAGSREDLHTATLAGIERSFGSVVSAKQVLGVWSRRAEREPRNRSADDVDGETSDHA